MGERIIETPQVVSDIQSEKETLAKLPPKDRERTKNLFNQVREAEQYRMRMAMLIDLSKTFV